MAYRRLWIGSLPRCCRTHGEPVLLRFRSSEFFIIAVVSVAWFTDLFLYGILVPVLPMVLNDRLGINDADRQYWTSIMLASFGTSQLFCALVFGYISDRLDGRKSFMYIGLISLFVATILLFVGRSIGLFILGRVLQGASAAMVGSVGLAIIADTVPSTEIGRAMGFVTISIGLSQVLAPVLGGLAYAHSGYKAVFAMAFGIIGLDLVLRLIMIERHDALPWESTVSHPSDIELHTDQSPATELTTVAVIRNGPLETETFASTPAELARTGLLTSFPALRLLSMSNCWAALWGLCVLVSLMTAFDSTLPLYTSDIFGFNSLQAGLLLFALLAPNLAGPIAGKLSDRFGRRWLATGGFIVMIPFLVLLRLVKRRSSEQIALMCVLLVLIGIALTVSMSPLMSEISICGKGRDGTGDEPKRPNVSAQAFGLASCAFAAGTVIGPVWGGLILARFGWGTMSWTLSILSIAAALASVVFLGTSID